MRKKFQKLFEPAAVGLMLAVMPLFTSCSSTPKSDANASESSLSATGTEIARGGVVVDALTGTATVRSVNAADRTVVLLHADGSTTAYECGPDVRNFDQIKVGDQVTATVAESVAVVLIKGGVSPAAGTASAIVRSPLGAKPGGRIVDTVGFTARILDVDYPARIVTLQTVDGQKKTLKVGPDVNLGYVNPGDDVGVKITRAFAISVQSPNSAPAALPSN
jgi:hypothetical protein